MNKLPPCNLKRTTKNHKNKKKQPLKVVYITNPIMFKTNSASEFRALVQEFTGQDAETPEYSETAVAYGGGETVEAGKLVAKDNFRYASAAFDYEGTKVENHYPYFDNMTMNGHDDMIHIGSDPMVFDPFYENVSNDPKMFESVNGFEGSSLWQVESFSSSSTTT